jgi:tetratricopeptide (TPR) repeat protein
MDMREIDQEAWALLRAGRVRSALLRWSDLNLALRQVGRLEDARTVARTMMHVGADESGAARLLGWYSLAETAREVGELQEAARWIGQALELHEQLGDPRGAARDLVSLGELAEAGGEFERAVGLWTHALGRLDADRSAETVYEILIDLGRAHAELGHAELAAHCALQADELSVRWAS